MKLIVSMFAVALLASLCALSTSFAQTRSPSVGSTEASAEMVAGNQAMRAGELPSAIEHFKSATSLSPHFAEAYLNLGLALVQRMALPEAVAALETAIRLKPTLSGANLFYGIAEYQMNDLEKARKALTREIKLSPKDAHALMWLGVVEISAGHPDVAAADLDRAHELAPADSDILYHRGRAHLLVSKASYQQMFASDRDSYRVHEVLGQANAEADRTLDAIGEYKLAIDRAPRLAGLHEDLADLYWSSGNTSQADSLYQQELELDPYSFTTTFKLGSLRVIDGNPQQGLPLLVQAKKLDPSYQDVDYYLGRAQVEVGQDEAGIANLRRASLAPGRADLNTLAFYQLSRVYRRLHQNEEANAALAQFRVLRDRKDAQQADKRASLIENHRQLPREDQIPTDAQASHP